MLNFVDINEYVLIKIFEYCSESGLENLYLVCQRFRDIIESVIYRKRSLELILTGHKNNPRNCLRTLSQLTFQDRVHISKNWLNGRYRETVLFQHRKWHPSQLFLERENFYMTNASTIRVHRRRKNEVIERKIFKEIGADKKAEIICFTKRNETIFAGRHDGNCFIYENDYVTEQRLHDLKEYLIAVDFFHEIFMTSTDRSCKMWKKDIELGLINFELIKDFKESFMCMKFNENGERIMCGMYSDLNRRALREIDVETGTQKIYNSDTLSIYDLMHKDDATIFTANFDTSFRIFDKRMDKDVARWEDPYDSSVYCLAYDGLYGVLCGMKHHCRVNLYDIRMPQKFAQMYFPSLRRMQGSPVYDVACDCQHLFVATDHNLRVFDFKSDWATCRDYRNIFVNS